MDTHTAGVVCHHVLNVEMVHLDPPGWQIGLGPLRSMAAMERHEWEPWGEEYHAVGLEDELQMRQVEAKGRWDVCVTVDVKARQGGSIELLWKALRR